MSGKIFVENFGKLSTYDETQNISLAPVFVDKLAACPHGLDRSQDFFSSCGNVRPCIQSNVQTKLCTPIIFRDMF